MKTTTYYDLNIVEGTDIVNPLTVDNPNYEKIDEVMHDNAVAGVTLATEIANATVHAITRENSDCAVIRFIATSQWKAGDTATVDGVPVTVLLPNGETLPDGAYVINANVLCILTGTNLTFYLSPKKVANANEIAFNDTTVGAELVRLDGKVARLDGEVARLDGKIDNVNSNFAVVSGTLLSDSYQWKTVAYPNGFNVDNTFIIGIDIIAASGSKYTGEYINGNRIYETFLSSDGINIKATHQDTYGLPFKILIAKR